MSTVTIRVDEITKKEAASVAHEFGFDLSSITRAFYRQIARTRRIPLTLDEPIPNDETLEAIAEAREILDRGESAGNMKTAKDVLKAARQ